MNVGRELPDHVLFSCMALNVPGLAELESWPAKPGVIEWMPRTVKPGSHPSWIDDGMAYRDPSTKRLLPRLLQMFGRRDPSRIAAFGFSAGSNSGVRELLRSPEDREALSMVAMVDGLHAMKAMPALYNPEDPRTFFVDWAGQVAPCAEYALRAARGQAVMVLTGNNIVPIPDTNTRTAEGMQHVFKWVEKQSGIKPYNEKVVRVFADLGEPTPAYLFGRGNLFCFGYNGTQAKDHIAQAKVVIPRILRHILKPLWTGRSEA